MKKQYLNYLFLLVMSMLTGTFSIAQTNQYLHFDQQNDYISLPNAAAALNGSNTISMAGWFYTDSLKYGQGMMSIRGGGTGSGEMYVIQLSNGLLECRATTTTGLKNYHSPNNTVVAGTWQHIAWVMNTDSIRLYINGIQIGRVANSGTFVSTDKPFTVGRCIVSNLNFYYGGRVDEVSLWKKALSQAEIQNMMANELLGTETNLVAYYKFNQGIPGGNNTSISSLVGLVPNTNAQLLNFGLNGATSNFNGTLQPGYQAISFPAIPNKLITDPAFQATAFASSGLPITYSIVSGPATVSGNTITLNGTAGTVTVKASQAGNGTYTAATDEYVSFEVLDPTAVLVNAKVLHPLAGNVYAPSLMPIKVGVFADIEYTDLFSIQSLTAQIDGNAVTLTDNGNGFYTGWWTPTAYGSHTLTVTGTNNFNHNSTTTATFNLANAASNISVAATNQAWVNQDVDVVVQESDLPSYIGAYDQIIGKLNITCPTGGCDPWDRVSHIEVQDKEGEWHEIIRYLTPYGVACNSEIDLTDFASLLLGKTKFRVSLGTSGNGFLYTLNLEYRAGTAAHPYSRVQKLWYKTYQFGDMTNLQPAETFTKDLYGNVKEAKIKLVATGHGWGDNNTGNAAEFQRNIHHIWVNNAQTFTHDNWYTCNPNPDGCSPQNGTWYYNRAGWCPGTISQFYDYDMQNFLGQTNVSLKYIFDENYKDLCHPNNPNCVSGTTCPNCNDGFNPHLITISYLVTKADNPNALLSIGKTKTPSNTMFFYPNPASGDFNIDFSKLTEAGSISIYDITGKVVKSQVVAKGQKDIKVDVKGLASGAYMVVLFNGEAVASTNRIVIENR